MPKMRKELISLRKAMKENFIDAVLLTGSDPHQNEYLSDTWAINRWLSGFTGSNSSVVVTQDHAGLWTDSRYFIQAENELLDTGFTLHKLSSNPSSNYLNWLSTHLKAKDSLAYLAISCSHSQMQEVENNFTDLDIRIKKEIDLITICWEDRPKLSENKITELSTAYCGVHASEKIKSIRSFIGTNNSKWLLITTLDDIAWTLNLRGTDIPYNPLFFSYLLIGLEEIILYMDSKKLTADSAKYLKDLNIRVLAYQEISANAPKIVESEKIILDPSTCNDQIFDAFDLTQVVKMATPTRLLKAIKNNVEIKNIEKAMITDGIALCKAFFWLENHVDKQKISEFDFACKLLDFRSENVNFKGNSFETIVGFKANAAIVHYRPDEKHSALIQSNGILLVDSGAQYLTGTTDITRTICLGPPSEEQKLNFTLVLKGHISLDTIQFPEGTNGSQLDVLARQHLWKSGLNYGHGTGHGVGFYLNVHEPPQGYAPGTSSRATTPLVAGMFSSNEPGYYKENEYGIRIENLILVEKSEFDGFLKHRHLSLFPIDTTLLSRDLLAKDEINWLNDYHELVYNKLNPELDSELQQWLKIKCKKI